jgi:hypothetical protein
MSFWGCPFSSWRLGASDWRSDRRKTTASADSRGAPRLGVAVQVVRSTRSSHLLVTAERTDRQSVAVGPSPQNRQVQWRSSCTQFAASGTGACTHRTSTLIPAGTNRPISPLSIPPALSTTVAHRLERTANVRWEGGGLLGWEARGGMVLRGGGGSEMCEWEKCELRHKKLT